MIIINYILLLLYKLYTRSYRSPVFILLFLNAVSTSFYLIFKEYNTSDSLYYNYMLINFIFQFALILGCFISNLSKPKSFAYFTLNINIKTVLFLSCILVLYTSIIYIQLYGINYEMLLAYDKIGLRSLVVSTDSKARIWYLENGFIGLSFVLSIYLALNIHKRLNLICLILLYSAMSIYCSSLLGRSRLIDCSILILIVIIHAYNIKRIKTIFYGFIITLLLITVFSYITYIRVNLESGEYNLFFYIINQSSNYLIKATEWGIDYLNQNDSGEGEGNYTFRFFLLVLNQLNLFGPLNNPPYAVYDSVGNFVVFHTPNIFIWIYHDAGILFGFIFCIFFGYAMESTFTKYSNSNSMSMFRLAIAYLFAIKSVHTYLLYDIWFWIILIFFFVKIHIVYPRNVK